MIFIYCLKIKNRIAYCNTIFYFQTVNENHLMVLRFAMSHTKYFMYFLCEFTKNLLLSQKLIAIIV